MKMCETGVKVEFEKKAFEQIRQNASQVLNSDDAPDVTEYNKGNATSGLLASQGLLTNLNDYVSEYGWDKIITGSLADTGKYDEQGMMGSGDWYGITTGAVKKVIRTTGNSINKQHILILVSAALFPGGRNHLSTKEQQQ